MFIYDTFVTCFTSYLGKSRDKSDNCPITLFISYSTHLCMNWTQVTKKEWKTRICAKVISPGEPMASNSREFQVPSPQRWPWRTISPGEAMTSSSREFEKQDKSNLPWREIFLPGEIRRFHLILKTWQKPTGKESSFRHGELNFARREVTFQHMYKSPFSSFHRRDSQDHWDIMAFFHSISSFSPCKVTMTMSTLFVRMKCNQLY